MSVPYFGDDVDSFLSSHNPGSSQKRTKRGGKKKRKKKKNLPSSAHIFCCTNETYDECIDRGLFGGPTKFAEHEEIFPGLPLFLYNTEERQLSGPYMAETSVGLNLMKRAWEGRFPYQVKWAKNKGWRNAVGYVDIPPSRGFFPQGKVTLDRYNKLLDMLELPPVVLNIEELRGLADQYGLQETFFHSHSYVIGFEGNTEAGFCKFDVYYTTGNVKTSLHHPKQGKTQRFRVPCDMDMVELLFSNPRLHTNVGY